MALLEAKAALPEVLSHPPAEARHDPPPPTPDSHRQEVRVWALMLVLGLATFVAGYILWAKVSGF